MLVYRPQHQNLQNFCKHHYTHSTMIMKLKPEEIEDKVSFIKPEGNCKFDQAKTMEDHAKIFKRRT